MEISIDISSTQNTSARLNGDVHINAPVCRFKSMASRFAELLGDLPKKLTYFQSDGYIKGTISENKTNPYYFEWVCNAKNESVKYISSLTLFYSSNGGQAPNTQNNGYAPSPPLPTATVTTTIIDTIKTAITTATTTALALPSGESSTSEAIQVSSDTSSQESDNNVLAIAALVVSSLTALGGVIGVGCYLYKKSTKAIPKTQDSVSRDPSTSSIGRTSADLVTLPPPPPPLPLLHTESPRTPLPKEVAPTTPQRTYKSSLMETSSSPASSQSTSQLSPEQRQRRQKIQKELTEGSLSPSARKTFRGRV